MNRWLLVCLLSLPFAPAPASEAGPAAGNTMVEGAVVDGNGKSVGAARVSLIVEDFLTRTQAAVLTADTDGRFQLEIPSKSKWEDGRLTVLVEAPGFGITPATVPAEGARPLKIVLRAATEVEVIVVDEAGVPLPGVRLRPEMLIGGSINDFAMRFPSIMAERFAQTSDGDGVCRFNGLPQNARLRLAVADAHFARPDIGEDISLAGSPLSNAKKIVLIPAATIEGTVLYQATGKPAAGIRVGAQGVNGQFNAGDSVTDELGRYAIRQMRPGSCNVEVDLRGELAAAWTARAHEKVAISAGERLVGVDFELIPGAVVSGHVLAEDTGEPLAGMRIGVYGPARPRSGAWVQGTKSGVDGGYLLRVPPGSQHIYLQSLPPKGFGKPTPTGHDVVVADAEIFTLDFKLPRQSPSKPVLIRVLDPKGNPAPDAEVFVGSRRGEHAPMEWTARRSDQAGTVRIEPSDTFHPQLARARSGTVATRATLAIADGAEVTLPLEKNTLCCILGRVADSDGNPIVYAALDLTEWSSGGGLGKDEGVSGNEGRFEIKGLWPGTRYTVQATAKHFTWKNSAEVTLEPGETRELDPLILNPATQVIAGRVVNEKGESVQGMSLILQGAESAFQQSTTDRDGRFRFEGLANEKVSLNTFDRGSDGLVVTAIEQAGDEHIQIITKPRDGRPH